MLRHLDATVPTIVLAAISDVAPADVTNLGIAAVAIYALSQAVGKLSDFIKGMRSGEKAESKDDGLPFRQTIAAIQENTKVLSQLYTYLNMRDQEDKEWRQRLTVVMDNLVRGTQHTTDRLEVLADEVRRITR